MKQIGVLLLVTAGALSGRTVAVGDHPDSPWDIAPNLAGCE